LNPDFGKMVSVRSWGTQKKYQGLKPTFIHWLHAGDKSPAYRPDEFFRSLE
jgi:hypothetical protein